MWPFRKKPTPPAPPTLLDDTGFNYDWKVGDLAKCVNDQWFSSSAWNPAAGDILKVTALVPVGPSACGTKSLSGLRFEGKPKTKSWWCGQFIKAAQDTAVSEIEEGLVEKIKHAATQGAGA